MKLHKTLTLTILISGFVFFFAHTPVEAAEPDVGIEIINETEQTLTHLFVRPVDSDLYGGDVLSMIDEMEPEDSMTAGVSIRFAETLLTVMAVDDEGEVYEIEDIHVSVEDSGRQPVRIGSDDHDSSADTPELSSVTVRASYDTDIYYLYLERNDSRAGGANLTGGELLHEGASADIRYISEERDELGDFLAVDSFGTQVRIDGPGE